MTLNSRNTDNGSDVVDHLVTVFQAHRRRLGAYAAHLTRSLSLPPHTGGDDLLNQAALVAYEKAIIAPEVLPQDERALVAWLARTVLYLALNTARRNRTEKSALDEYQRLITEHEIRSADEEDPSIVNENLRRLLRQLSGRDRQILRLSLIECLTSAEIGHRLGMSDAAVRQAKGRLIQRLHRSLTSE